ncbi:MAG: hypothetical protein ACE1Y4_00135, partial [Lysobacterales bacterium]
KGDLVKLELGYGEGNPNDNIRGAGTNIYRYLGDDATVDLATQDYTGFDFISTAGNTTLNNGDLVKLVAGYGDDDEFDNIKGDGLRTYRYVDGSGVLRNLATQDYTNTALWDSVDAQWESVGSARLTTQDYGNIALWRQVNLAKSPIEVQAYVLDSSITSSGNLKSEAVSSQRIDALVIAGAVAASAGGTGVSVAGAGVAAVNLISANVSSFIDGAGTGATIIEAGTVSVTAMDTSTINAITGAATLAAGFGGTGVAIAIGVSVAHNSISNEVSAFIVNVDDVNDVVKATSGAITIAATESASISTISTAAAVSIAIGGTGVAISGAGAFAANTILTRTNAYVMDSNLVTQASGDVVISASDTSTIDATVAAVAVAVAGG